MLHTVNYEKNQLGEITRYFYDQTNGRLLAVAYPNGDGVAYTYDAIGNLTMVRPATLNADNAGCTANDASASVEYTYDAHNQLASITTESTVDNAWFLYSKSIEE